MRYCRAAHEGANRTMYYVISVCKYVCGHATNMASNATTKSAVVAVGYNKRKGMVTAPRPAYTEMA